MKSATETKWLDAVKGLALLWIVTNHVTERIFGSEYFGNPSATWPPLTDRIAQLAPLHGLGVMDVPLNLMRYIGWTGDDGVGLFLLASGFGLTFGLLRLGRPVLDLLDFYRRRALRIYPLWWTAHIAFALAWLFTGWGIPFTHKGMYLSMLGVRFTPGTFDFFSPSWWFIGLLIQLYLVYPLLWRALRVRGPLWLFFASAVVAIAARLAGLFLGHAYMPEWERGAFFLTRLPEFVAGMSLAAYWVSNARGVDAALRAPATIALGAALFAAGTAASITLLGNAVAPLLSTIGSFIIAYALAFAVPRGMAGGLQWTGKHSYSLYLVHQPLIMLIVPAGLTAGGLRTGADVALALFLTVLAAFALEAVSSAGVALVRRWLLAFGPVGTAWRLAGVACAALAVFAGTELLVERFGHRRYTVGASAPRCKQIRDSAGDLRPRPRHAFAGWGTIIPSSPTSSVFRRPPIRCDGRLGRVACSQPATHSPARRASTRIAPGRDCWRTGSTRAPGPAGCKSSTSP
jgi:peptidoglycan/LPS O-acetylase OafA/YrhL